MVEYILWFLTIYGPPMASNGFPVLVRGEKPLDKGKNFIDNRRILGDGKTVEGLAAGLLGGYTASLSVAALRESFFYILAGLAASAAALLGDIAASFIKRRLGLERGAPLPLVDQLDFMVAATLTYMALGLIGPGDAGYVAYSFIIVAALHVASNNIAYILGLKQTRW